MVRTQPFVAVVGASGSGKSSLVGAGLIPRLKRNLIAGSQHWWLPDYSAVQKLWTGLRFTPGINPFLALAKQLTPVVRQPEFEIAEWLQADPSALLSFVTSYQNRSVEDAHSLVFIDQFEELFTLTDERYRTPFIQFLKAVAALRQIHIVMTVRADFYARCVEDQTLRDLVEHGTYPLAAPDTAALLEMIANPAQKAGLTFESGLVNQILRDTGADPGALALMAYAIDELYQATVTDGKTENKTLTTALYRQIGTVQGAIGIRAENTFAGLSVSAQEALPAVFSQLVGVDVRGEPTRRRVLRQQLATIPDALRLIDTFIEARLLLTERNEHDAPTIEVAHEALLREWTRLRNWIGSVEADLRLRTQLESAARLWSETPANKKTDYVLLGTRLEEAQRWQASFSNAAESLEAQYIAASAQYEQQQEADRLRKQRELARRTQVAALFGIGAVIAILIGLLSFLTAQNAANQASARADSADTQVATAGTQVAVIAQTLTPIPSLLAAVQGAAATAGTQAALANANVTLANQNLAALTPTLKAIATQVQVGQNVIESQRLAGLANDILNDSAETDKQVAALLAIRALNKSYSEAADTALVKALDGTFPIRPFATGHTGSVLSVAFSPNGQYALTGSVDGTARLWETRSGQNIRTFTGHTNYVQSVAFSPDGQFVLTGSGDKTARLWETQSGKSIRIFTGHTNSVYSVTFSPDGQYVLTGSGDNTAQLWETRSGQHVRTFIGHIALVRSVAFSPDGQYVLTGSGDNTARLWDTRSGQLVRTLAGHTDAVQSVAFSLDGRYIVTGGLDKTARLWEVRSGQLIRTLAGHTSTMLSVALSPDGQYVLTGSGDNTARLWETTYQEFLEVACRRVWRDFMVAERVAYRIDDNEPTCPHFDASLPSTGISTPTPIVYTWTPIPTRPIPVMPTLPRTVPADATLQPTEKPSSLPTFRPVITATLEPITWTPIPTRTIPIFTPLAIIPTRTPTPGDTPRPGFGTLEWTPFPSVTPIVPS
jgi:hypothetical protein